MYAIQVAALYEQVDQERPEPQSLSPRKVERFRVHRIVMHRVPYANINDIVLESLDESLFGEGVEIDQRQRF